MNRLATLVAGKQAVCGKCKADLETTGTTAHVDLAALDRAVAASPARVLVDFWAPWCMPCRGFAPVLERFAKEQAGRIIILKLDTEANPDAGARFAIQAIPTLVLFREGHEVGRMSGAQPIEQLRHFAPSDVS
jgi:thioredoxin 2